MSRTVQISTRLYAALSLAERLGWRMAWYFHAGVALVVGLGVALSLYWLDDVSPLSALGAGVLALVPGAISAALVMHLAHALAQTTRLHDPLGEDQDEFDEIHPRRQFLRLAEREWQRCRRYGDDGALLLIETDGLQHALLPRLGLLGTDAVQRDLSRLICLTLRQSDILAHMGPGRLGAFLPHTDPLGALDAAERIRQRVASTLFEWQQHQMVLTVAVGVSHVHVGQQALEGLLHEAGVALQLAQEEGGDCVRAAPVQHRLRSRPLEAVPTTP